jgi:exodeoxyribonuclease VIII
VDYSERERRGLAGMELKMKDYFADSESKSLIGIHPGMSRSDYLKIKAVNVSLLVEGERSMAHLKWAMDHAKEPTDAMKRGTAVHMAVFEPEEFESKTVVFEGVRRGKEKFKESNFGKTILKQDDFDCVISMRDALRRHERVADILESTGTGEMAVVWKDEETGLLCKGLVDRFCKCWGYTIVPDLKSCQDARPIEFSKTVYNYHYHTKAAFYHDGLAAIANVPRRFLWIAVESEQPHGIMIYDPSETMMQTGRRNYRRLLNAFAECLKSGVFPGYPLGEETIELPKWADK